MRLGFGFGLGLVGFNLVSLVACGGSGESHGTATQSAEAILGGTQHSESEVADLLSQAGFADSDVPRMVCTAKYESSFFDGAKGYNRDSAGKLLSTDWGLFQINDRAGWPKTCGVTTSQLLDAATNTQCAKMVFDQQGITAWYGYQHHRSECDSYQVSGWSGSGGGGYSSSGAGGGGGGGGGGGSGGYCAAGQTTCDDGSCAFADGHTCSDPSQCCSYDCTYGTCGSGSGGGGGSSSGGGGYCAGVGQACNDGPDCCGYADNTATCQQDPYNANLARCVRTRH
jgi:hypothetical protein